MSANAGRLLRLLLAALAGAVVALIAAALLHFAWVASRGYRAEDYVEFPGWVLGLIAGGGAVIGAGAALRAGRRPLSRSVRGAALGALAGVGVAVAGTLGVATAAEGGDSKRRAAYEARGLIYGVPAGLLVGGLAGYLLAKRPRA